MSDPAIERNTEGVAVRWVVVEPGSDHDSTATADGLNSSRDLLQLRLALPLSEEILGTARPLTLRGFRPGPDETAWLRVNNRSFIHDPDQSEQTMGDVLALESADWFDPSGFLLLESSAEPGEFDGFCWTKVHSATEDRPAMGEIFVIGVDPRAQGQGFGRALTIAGLDYLADIGLSIGMLYVDSANESAVSLYRALGFQTDHVERVYSRAGD